LDNKLKKPKFKLFDMNRDGKGVEPGEDTTPNLKYFFKQLWRKFSKIISLNMLMIFQAIPILVALYMYFVASPTTPTQYYPEFSALFGIGEASSTAIGAISTGIFSFQLGIPTYNTYVYWVIGAMALFLVITYGWQNVGAVYVTRGLVRGDSVFVVSDFFYAIKKNLKQGFFMGLIDCAATYALIHNILYYYSAPATPFTNFMYAMTFALLILYIIFRFYIYLMLVTFNMKIGKILKNALIFTVLGIKRNVMALLGLAVITAIAVGMIFLLLPMGLGVTIVLPLIYYLGVCCFITTYAAYPVIKKYMIDPVVVANESSDQ
jgi:uncharacterized membrane protein YesL